jgi:hypothetical protein
LEQVLGRLGGINFFRRNKMYLNNCKASCIENEGKEGITGIPKLKEID